MHKIVILTGAGVSTESGVATFRGRGGLWEGYRVDKQRTRQLIIYGRLSGPLAD